MGTLSVLISSCCCVLEAVQGSTVIGLFSYWGIQSRTEGYGSQWSDPRIPLPAFPPSLPALLLLLLLFCPQPPSIHSGTGALTGKTCGSWQAFATGERPQHHPLKHSSKSVSYQDQMEESGKLSHAIKEQASGNMSGKKKKKKNEGREDLEWDGGNRKPWKRCQDFLHQHNHGAPKCDVPSQTERSQPRNIEREMIQMVRRQKRFNESTAVEDRHHPDGQLSGFQ